MRFALLAIGLAACAGRPPAPVEPAIASVPAAVAPNPPATPAEPVLPLAGGANALAWDTATSTLYLTDSNADTLLRWTAHHGIETVATLPPATAGVGLGAIVRRADGSTLVAAFGYGKQGTLFALAADNTATALTGLDDSRRRIGLAQDTGGALYSAYFVSAHGDGPTGGVARVSIAGNVATETEVAGASTSAGFRKLVGLVATPSALFVTDQLQKAVFKIAVPGFTISKLADVPAPDMLALLPNGDLLAGSGSTILRITQTGTVTPLPYTGFEQVRGLAYDPAGKRLFVVNHSLTVGVPDKLHILPFVP
jgi:DNA-binding beta-propeller fold protein YncE